MEISLKDFLNEIRVYSPELFISNEEGVYLKTVKLIEREQTEFKPDYLYIGKKTYLPKFINLDITVNILCVSPSPVYLDNKEKTNVNLIVLQGDFQLPQVFNLINDIFLRQEQIDLKLEKLLDVLTYGSGIQHIIDVGSELLGNPLMLTDSTYKRLSCTKNVEMDDTYWNELVRDGFFSNESVTYLRTHRFFELMNRSSGPIFFGKDTFGIARIIWRIMIDNKIVGHLAVFELYKSLSEKDIRLFSKVCDIVTCEMQKNKFMQNTKGYKYEVFITDILNGKVKEKRIINERLKYLDLKLKENHYIMSINTMNLYDKGNISIQYLRDRLEQAVIGSKSVIYNENIVLILSRSIELSMQEAEIKSLVEMLKANNINCGVSRCFHELVDLQEYYFQSEKALKYGMNMTTHEVIFLYEDFAMFHLFDICSSHANPERFCHAAIFKLIEYDHVNNSSYINTLYTYLYNSKRLVETADELQIHRNTLSSRLKSIEEIMRINLDVPDTVIQLIFAFKILQFTGKIDLPDDYHR